MVLSKDTALYARDDKGELISEEVIMEIDEDDLNQISLKGEKIFVTPLSRGEIKTMFTDIDMVKDRNRDLDGEIIEKHCHNPKFTPDEIKAMKPFVANTIVNTVFRESGLQTPKKGDKKKSIKGSRRRFRKKLVRVKRDRKEADLILFLHNLGYNFFNQNRLTYSEINSLIDSWNREQKEKERQSKKK